MNKVILKEVLIFVGIACLCKLVFPNEGFSLASIKVVSMLYVFAWILRKTVVRPQIL